MFRMHTAHLANVSKSVTKNATFPRTPGLPCLITRQLHVCYISQLMRNSFSVSQQPPIWEPPSHYSMSGPLQYVVTSGHCPLYKMCVDTIGNIFAEFLRRGTSRHHAGVRRRQDTRHHGRHHQHSRQAAAGAGPHTRGGAGPQAGGRAP